ncbi:MAG: 16S rRNA (uracil(1498)-N(3))-methyltransferase [Limisphaerales bacterium]|jgi:16S rRNA (uracil1498-N3)-methyltransferase
MHRFFAPPEATRESEILLPESEAHHAAKVLRCRPGDRAVVLNGQGDEILGELVDVDKHSVRIRVLQRHQTPPPECAVTLAQAVTKPKSMETIIQKATELGATRIVPVFSERTVSLLDDSGAHQKAHKWRGIAIEAAKQCGTTWLPDVSVPLPIADYLEREQSPEVPFLASLQPDARHPRETFESFWTEHKRNPLSITVWIGPEGDFTPAEINAIRNTGAIPISLGPLVLRSETAALYCLSILSYEVQQSTKTPGK